MDSYSTGCSSFSHSASSARSKSTTSTVYSEHPAKSVQVDPCDYNSDPRGSLLTYASTTTSLEEAEETPQEPTYDVIDRNTESFPAGTLSSNPRIFASLFPSARRLVVRHDDATLDGNMNLRVDTVVWKGGYQRDVSMFHLRMHDLFSRKFSFRRYCRDSGVEVCHSTRKPVPAEKRWGNVLSSLCRSSSDARIANLKRRSSSRPGENEDLPPGLTRLSDTIALEFSNYAHVELKRKAGPSTRYEYEYWSTRYQWRQEYRKDGNLREVSYYLVNTQTSKSIAHILPEVLTPTEAVEEERRGGWVPAASMWISDSSAYERMPDIADAIVATGLTVLVDDCIRRRWHSSSLTRSMEFGAKKLMDVLYLRDLR